MYILAVEISGEDFVSTPVTIREEFNARYFKILSMTPDLEKAEAVLDKLKKMKLPNHVFVIFEEVNNQIMDIIRPAV